MNPIIPILSSILLFSPTSLSPFLLSQEEMHKIEIKDRTHSRTNAQIHTPPLTTCYSTCQLLAAIAGAL